MVEEMAAEKRRAEEALAELSAERKASEFRRGSVEAAAAAAVAEAVDGATQGLKVQMEELREQLHREIEARQAADILKEAAIKAQLELQDRQEGMEHQVAAAQREAQDAAENAKAAEEAARSARKRSGASVGGGRASTASMASSAAGGGSPDADEPGTRRRSPHGARAEAEEAEGGVARVRARAGGSDSLSAQQAGGGGGRGAAAARSRAGGRFVRRPRGCAASRRSRPEATLLAALMTTREARARVRWARACSPLYGG